MVYRKLNETERPWFWKWRKEKYYQNGEKRSGTHIEFQTSVVEPAGIPGHCKITIYRGVMVRDFGVYLKGTEIQYGGNPLTTFGSIVSIWHERKLKDQDAIEIRPVPVQL